MYDRQQEAEVKIASLEDQIKLLWEVLYDLPRLEGLHDSVMLASLKTNIKPKCHE